MADLPTPRSYPQVLGELIDGYTSRVGVRRLKVGGSILSALEAAAQSDFRGSQDTLRLLAAVDLDHADGLALARAGAQEGLVQRNPIRANTQVTFSDTSFAKISTQVFRGSGAPIVGTLALRVEEAGNFPASGDVYVGRGTANAEGPLHYASRSDAGPYWVLNLSTSTTKFHNVGEAVTLAQGGNRQIPVGAVVATQDGSLTAAVRFTTTAAAVIPDGEVEVSLVPVSCAEVGDVGNVPANSLEILPSPPFSGAAVTNTGPVTTGRDVESNDAFRERIRSARAARVRGTDLALRQAAVGVVSPDEGRTVVSAQLVRRAGQPSRLYVDDGSGYEEISEGVGVESVVDGAMGGEIDRETLNRPVAKAALRAREPAPYILMDSAQLSIQVGGVITTRSFDESEFGSIGSASSYEVAAAVNRDPGLLWGARTAEGGRFVEFFARAEENDDLLVIAASTAVMDAATAMDLPTSPAVTAALYRNDQLLSKDGQLAVLRSGPVALWGTLAGSQTITIQVDQTDPATYTITDQDFVDAGTPYATVARNDLQAWADVLNQKLPGITVTVETDRLALTSNRDRFATARVEISGGTLVTNLMFAPGVAAGVSADYTLDRPTGQITLRDALAQGDRLSLGTAWTRGFLETPALSPTDLPAGATLWFALDGDPSIVISGAGPTVNMSIGVQQVTDSGQRLAISANFIDLLVAPENPFANVLPGDWVVIFDSDPAVPLTWRRAWRVASVDVFVIGHLPGPGVDYKYSLVVEHVGALSPRFAHASCAISPATTLNRVFVTGGYTVDLGNLLNGTRTGDGATEQCEIYDPDNGAWVVAAPMVTPRAHHTATTLPDGRVLVAGGFGSDGEPLASTEIYNPITDTWSTGPTMAVARAYHTATLLNSGRVLLAGGRNTSTTTTANSIEFDYTSDSLVSSATMGTARYGHAALLLPAGAGTAGAEAGNVLIVGGRTIASAAAMAAERYNAAAPGWSNKATPPSGRWDLGLAYYDTQTVLAVGSGFNGSQSHTFVEYAVDTNTWGADTVIDTPNVLLAGNPAGLIRHANGTVYLLHATEDNGSSGIPNFAQVNRNPAWRSYNGTTWDDVARPTWLAAGVQRANATVTAVGTGADQVLVVHGGSNTVNQSETDFESGVPTASTEQFNPTDGWAAPTPLDATNVQLPGRGMVVVRTTSDLQRIEVPADVDYTAASLQPLVVLAGGQVTVYRTNRLRVATATNTPGGAIVLAASDAPDLLPIPDQKADVSTASHAAVATSGTDLGTPDRLQVKHILGASDTLVFTEAPDAPMVGAQPPGAGHVTTFRDIVDGQNPKFWHIDFPTGLATIFDTYLFNEQGDWGQAHRIGSSEAERRDADPFGTGGDTSRFRLGLRVAPRAPLGAAQPAILASPFAIGPTDGLTLAVDGERFNLSLARRTGTLDSYGSQVTLRDVDGGDVAFQDTFGPSFRFEDHAVYMRARGKTHPTDSTRRILWRYYRHGAEGEYVVLRYVYPIAPSATLSVTTALDQTPAWNDNDEILAFVDVVLGSGAARTNHRLSTSSRLGLARCNINAGSVRDTYMMTGFAIAEATRTGSGDPTRLRLTVPNDGAVAHGPDGTGLQVGDVLWLEVAVPGPNLYSGPFAIFQVDAFNTGTGQQDIYIAAGELHAGTSLGTVSNPGTVSFDPTGEATIDPTVAVGDLVALAGGDNTASDLPVSFVNAGSARVTAFGRQYLRARSIFKNFESQARVPVWTVLADPEWLQVFRGPTQTATAVAAAVNALAAVADSTCPITATVVGTGGGTITQATWDEMDDEHAFVRLRDGLNWVQTTVAPPGPSDETEFVLKRDPASELLTNSDWENEDPILVPVLAVDVATWLRTPAVTGLFTAAEIVASANSHAVQITSNTLGSQSSVEVQDGTGNAATAAVIGPARLEMSSGNNSRPVTAVVTVPRGEATGLVGGQWLNLDNTSGIGRSPWFTGSTSVNSVDGAGTWTFSGSEYPFTLLHDPFDGARIQIDLWNDLVAIRWSKSANFEYPTLSEVPEGAVIYLTAPTDNHSSLPTLAAANQGVFQILRSTESAYEVTVWVRNPNATAELGAAKVKALSSVSVIPGDVWSVATGALGSGNQGTWTIAEVGAVTPGGEQFVERTIRVDVTNKPAQILTSPVALGADAGLIQAVDGTPHRAIKQLLTVTPNQVDGRYADLQLDTDTGWGSFSETLGTVVSARDKLAFPDGVFTGVDGYRYATGLVGEVNRVVYGDPADEVTYPGYAAAGARVLVSGPVVRRVQLAIQVRVRSGAANQDLADRVRSAAASAVNRVGVGAGGIAISDVVASVSEVPGVLAVSVVVPSYGPVHDRIELGPGEKPLVLSLRNDVRVSFVEG